MPPFFVFFGVVNLFFVSRYVKVQLSGDLQPRLGTSSYGVILLENPCQENLLNFSGLCDQIEKLFGLHGVCFIVSVDGIVLSNEVQVLTLQSKVLTVSPANHLPPNGVSTTPNFSFIDLECGNKKCTVLLTNQASPEQHKAVVKQYVKTVFKSEKFSLVGSLTNGQTVKVKLG